MAAVQQRPQTGHYMFPGDVWIIGDSIVRRAVHRLGCRPQVHWNGLGGARYSTITQLLCDLDAQWPSPGMLIVHVGTNDLVDTDAFCLRQRITVFMRECRERYPNTRLVWSDIFLPRACYFGAFSQSRMEMKRRSINKWARSFSRSAVLHHPQFKWSAFTLFRFDAVHLSPAGNEYFRENLRNCIVGAFY